MQTYMMSWNHTRRRTGEAVNQVLLRLYPQDLIETFWTNRYLLSMRNKPSLKPLPTELDDTFIPMRILFIFVHSSARNTLTIFASFVIIQFMKDNHFSLVRLQVLFYFTAPGWLLSILIFLLELCPRFTTPLMRCLHYPNILNRHRV
ncbi:hypothetical protein PRIPAC_92274 [Pristionchus pacificus]|uniref:Uncharacterized protein n=1 Tax=Pristionchus pacificus TaxID=54126 RepID=A0A2A6BR26_PRIPA|nr:hypothetical protein PRIPAC_92274 [Pristionchus pacificus]|eukprot:PDM68243.1 hypothetical protein PRIPAC_46287 [Pristionchus pacificus]